MRTKKKGIAPYGRGPTRLRSEIDDLPPLARRAFTTRLDTLVTNAIGTSGLPLDDALDVVGAQIGSSSDLLWLAYAVLAGELPGDETMNDLQVRARLGGTWAALAPLLERYPEAERFRPVEVLRGAVTCDVHETASSQFMSGIQRVVRETVSHWLQTHDVQLVAWTSNLAGFRRITDTEHRRLFGTPLADDQRPGVSPVVIPWEGTHVWGEVVTELSRVGRLLALSQYSRNRTGVLGHDCIPITTSSTVAGGMTAHFARTLAAVRRTDRVAMVSKAAATEFTGCMAMGAGRRDKGPEVTAIPLAFSSRSAAPDDLEEARRTLTVPVFRWCLSSGVTSPARTTWRFYTPPSWSGGMDTSSTWS